MNRVLAQVLAVLAFSTARSASSGGGSGGSSDGGAGASSGGSSGAGSGGSGGSCASGSGVSPNACHGTCNPCTRVTAAQASAVVGVTLSAGHNSSNSHQCTWTQYDSSGLPIVSISLDSNINATGFTGICSGPSTNGVTVTPVSGVGDFACFDQVQGLGGPILNFEKGCWAYGVSMTGSATTYPDATMEALEKMLALDALPSL